ncbi:MAG: hypothetical protein M3R30_05245 [Candidatus Eremiobacteraeota bacterium]|nr:hypothetical protein [Candidatus Eremiobacteraeota bacterium]
MRAFVFQIEHELLRLRATVVALVDSQRQVHSRREAAVIEELLLELWMTIVLTAFAAGDAFEGLGFTI